MGVLSSLHYNIISVWQCLINFHLDCFSFVLIYLFYFFSALTQNVLRPVKFKPMNSGTGVTDLKTELYLYDFDQSALPAVRICWQMMTFIAYLCTVCVKKNAHLIPNFFVAPMGEGAKIDKLTGVGRNNIIHP